MENVSALTWSVLLRIASDVWRAATQQHAAEQENGEGDHRFPPEEIDRALDVYRDLALKDCDIAWISDLIGPQRFTAPKPAQRRLYIPREIKCLRGIVPGAPSMEFMGVKAPHDEDDYIDETAFEKWERSSVGKRIVAARRLIVWGDAGSGKTSLIRWLTTGLLLRRRKDPEFAGFPGAEMLPGGDLIPIVARCRDLEREDLTEWLKDVMRTALGDEEKSRHYIEALVTGFKDEMEKGNALLLIDGADEVSNFLSMEQFLQSLLVITKAFPKAKVAITSNYSTWRGARSALDHYFEHVAQVDLNAEDKKDFAKRWCGIAVPEKRRSAKIEEFQKAVDASATMLRLTEKPMPLTMLAMVVAGPGGSPKGRVELYNESIGTLVHSPNIDSGVVDRSESFPQLGYIAFEMWRRDVHRLPEARILEMLEEFWQERPELRPIRDHTAEEFFRLAKSRTSILVEEKDVGGGKDAGKLYGFRHRIFRDYLAGRALAEGLYEGCDSSKPVAERVREMTRKIRVFKNVGSDWEYEAAGKWVDVLRVCVASCDGSDVDKILRAILKSGEEIEPDPEEEQGDETASIAGKPEYTGRPQAVLAALCLAEEDRASKSVAKEIITGLVGHSDGYRNPDFMETLYHKAGSALGRSKWGAGVREELKEKG